MNIPLANVNTMIQSCLRSAAHGRLPALLLAIVLALGACSQPTGTPVATPQVSAEAPPTPAVLSSPTPTTPSEPDLVLLVAPEGVDPAVAVPVQEVLKELAENEGFRFETLPVLEGVELAPDVRMVFLLPPDPGAASLATANPQVQFAALGIDALQPSSNLSLGAAPQGRPDQSGFLAGYLSAVITPDWRVGVISLSETTTGKAARQGFIHGVVFYCGLCRPAYPPFVQYPIDVALPAGAGQAEQQAAVDQLSANAVQTVYVSPEVSDPSLLEALAQAGIEWIGGSPPPDPLRGQYVASILFDQEDALRTLWPKLVAGDGGSQASPTLVIRDVNPELLSPGRLAFVEQLLADLAGGYVDSGVDPQTGEQR